MSYHIEDEPRPGALQTVAVRPFWPLLGVMLGGAWLAWPWFVLNSVAVGSPTLKRELAWAAGGFAGSAVLIFGILHLHLNGLLAEPSLPYALLALTVWKLWVSYRLFVLQSRTFELYEYFGGEVKNGMLVVLAALFFARQALLTNLPSDFLVLLLQ